MLCQPKPFASCISPIDFDSLSLPKLVCLLQEVGKQKVNEAAANQAKASGYAAAVTAIQHAQK